MAVQRVQLIQRSIQRLLDHVTETELNRRADHVLVEAKRLAPKSDGTNSFPSKDTGTLANSLVKGFTTQRGRRIIRIFSNATNSRGQEYSRFVIRGTRPHVIRARNAQKLKFFWIREQAPMGIIRVNHPGTRPNNFLQEALKLGFRR